jgi:alpha-tubulin suppressor-like RCC1 family protein
LLHLVYGFAHPVAAAGATASPMRHPERQEEPEPLRDVTDLAAGLLHACAVDATGQVWCWGINDYGQLGDNTRIDRSGAVPVAGLAGKAAAVSAGMFNSCALLVDGIVQCWGMHHQERPITVTGWRGKATAITAGRRNCALTDSAEVYCWHDSGPQAIHKSALTEPIRAVTAGYEHVCVLTESGGVRCWGWNYIGQLGDGTRTESETPVQVKGLESGVVAIDTEADTTCALTDAGAVFCWGAGPLGDGTRSYSPEPVLVGGLDEAVTALAVSAENSCVHTATGKILCWGNNHFGQVGGGDPTDELSPVALTELAGTVQEVVAGGGYTCARMIDHTVACWGGNGFGQLGNGALLHSPQPVYGLDEEITAVQSDFLHTCALSVAKAIYCWGMNDHSQLGDGTEINRARPVRVRGANLRFTAIAVGRFHTCALSEEQAFFCWGKNDRGQLGLGDLVGVPYPIRVWPPPTNPPFVQIAAGSTHTCAVADTGELYCWGGNRYGQVGDDTTVDRLSPTKVANLTEAITTVAAGGAHTCALSATGKLYCWGNNLYGQLGDGTTISRTVPIQVSLPGTVQAVATADSHMCALLTDGAVYCWGNNMDGQLGDGSDEDRVTPTAVQGITEKVTFIGIGTNHSCAGLMSGRLLCWGDNVRGQLGDGTELPRTTPTTVPYASGTFAAMSGGIDHSCALTTDGGVHCWGDGGFGRVAHAPNWPPSTVVKAPVYQPTFLPLIRAAR